MGVETFDERVWVKFSEFRKGFVGPTVGDDALDEAALRISFVASSFPCGDVKTAGAVDIEICRLGEANEFFRFLSEGRTIRGEAMDVDLVAAPV